MSRIAGRPIRFFSLGRALTANGFPSLSQGENFISQSSSTVKGSRVVEAEDFA
jgi:hypothetical protein